MKIVLIAVGVLVAGGVAAIIALNLAGPGDAAAPSPGPSATTDAAAATPGPIPGATPTTGSEVPPPTAAPGAGLPPLEPANPLIKPPLPAPGSREGGLVAGYPPRIIDPLEGSEIVSTTIATEDTVMQVSLVASSTSDPDAIRSHYLKLWTSLGLLESTAADDDLAVTGAYESLTLSVRATGTGNLYTIFGVFRTE